MIQGSESMVVGVVVERREVDNPWTDYAWHAVAVIPGAPPVDEWRVLREGEDWIHYHAATLTIEIFPGETEGYKVNLSNRPPAVYVVLRAGEEAGDHDVEPFMVTVCPYEAQDYLDSGEDIVDGVAMPDMVHDWVKDFVDKHFKPERFVKRKRKNWHEDTAGTDETDGGTRPRRRLRSRSGTGR